MSKAKRIRQANARRLFILRFTRPGLWRIETRNLGPLKERDAT